MSSDRMTTSWASYTGLVASSSALLAVKGVASIENVDITNLTGKRGYAVYKDNVGRTIQDTRFPDVDLIEIEIDQEVEALRKMEEMEKLREKELKAQGNQAVAELNANIDEENDLLQYMCGSTEL